MYNKGDIVQYGTNGICDIIDITTVDFKDVDKDRLYYVLKTRNNSGTIYVAVDGDTSKMRKMISREDAELFKLIKCLYFRKKQRLDEGKKVTAIDEKYMEHNIES